jgi:AcrB/AcrD/AcrF family
VKEEGETALGLDGEKVFSPEEEVMGMRSRNGKNRTPSSKFRGAISNGLSGSAANEAEEKSLSGLTSCRQKGALMKFYDVALAQGIHDKVLTYDFFRFVSGAQDAFVIAIQPPSVRGMGNAGGFQLEIEDHRNAGLNALQQATDAVIAAANTEPGLSAVFTTYRSQVPQLFLNIDRERCRA